jgi:hypothetical protein
MYPEFAFPVEAGRALDSTWFPFGFQPRIEERRDNQQP